MQLLEELPYWLYRGFWLHYLGDFGLDFGLDFDLHQVLAPVQRTDSSTNCGTHWRLLTDVSGVSAN